MKNHQLRKLRLMFQTTTIRSNDEYYELTESPDTMVIVLGEVGELWTEEVLKMLEEGEVHVNFFPWASIEDVRLQLEAAYYPILQVWRGGSLRHELVGYHCESIKKILEQI